MVLKIGQPGKAQAEDCPGDRQTGRQDNVSDPAIGGVVGRFRVLAGLTCLLIPPDEEYPVIGSGRDAEENQHINGKRREHKNIVMAEKRDDSSGRR